MKRLLLVLAVLSLASSAMGQHWKKYTNPASLNDQQDPVPYFLNSQIGFIYSNNSNSQSPQFDDSTSHLNRTLDGALNWKPIIFFDTSHCRIKQLYFTSINHGYAAGSRGVYETFDTGSTWKRISSDESPYCSVYSAGTTVFAFGYPPKKYIFGKLTMSTDDGKSWTEVFPPITTSTSDFDVISPYVFGNKDSLVFAESYDAISFALWVSKDNGRSWETHHFAKDPQGLFCFPHCNRIVGTFYPPGSSNTTDQSSIEESDDYGVTWKVIMPGREIGQWLAGNNCALYVSDANEQADIVNGSLAFLLGPMRSTDGGNTWDTTTYPNSMKWGPEFIEIDDHEFVISINQKIVDNYISDWRNLSVVGYGAIIYAGDGSDSLWKSTDGGDGRLSVAALAPQFELNHNYFQSGTDTFAHNPCQPDSLQVYSLNIGCSYSKFDSISIVGLDPSEYSVNSTHYCTCQPMPDTSFITLQPKTNGTRDVTIHYHFTDDEFNQVDTSIRITLVAKTFKPVLHANPAFDFANLSPCVILDTIISLINANPCDTMYAQNLQGSGLTSITNETPLPDTIPPNGSLRIKIVSTPADSGGAQASVHVSGLGYDSIFQIHVTRESLATMNPASFDFGTLSTCIPASGQTIFFNNTCDSVEITSIDSAFDSRFGYGPISLPLWIRGLDSISIPISFSSRTASLLHDSLTVHLISANGKATTSIIQLSARVLPSSFVLGFLPDTTFSTMLPCEAFDTTIHFVNKNQCDTIVISSLKGSDSLTPSADATLPDSIAPNGSLGVRISISSKDTNGEQFSVEVLGPAYDSIFRFQLFRGAPPNVLIYVGAASLRIRAGDTIDIPVYLSGNVALVGATSITLPFALDTTVLRVLSFNPALSGITVGSLAYSAGTETVPLQSTDLTVNGETLIGTLRCIVYLADTLQTSVSLAGATLSNEDSRCVSLSLQTNVVNIALTGCGDSTLLRFMKDGTFEPSIASIAPNPITSSLLVRWNGGGVTYDITDALGILRERNSATSNQSEIDVRSWPSGVYYLRARGVSGMVSMRRFVVAK